MSVDYSPEAIEARLRQVAELTDLHADRRLHPKIDYSPEAITRRLQQVEALRRACVELASLEPVPD